MEENKTVRNQCSFCAHNNVCRYTEKMADFTDRVREAYGCTTLSEVFIDHVDICCKEFDKKPTGISRGDICP